MTELARGCDTIIPFLCLLAHVPHQNEISYVSVLSTYLKYFGGRKQRPLLLPHHFFYREETKATIRKKTQSTLDVFPIYMYI